MGKILKYNQQERKGVSRSMWRKKVDNSIFKWHVIPFPNFQGDIWGFNNPPKKGGFKGVTKKKDDDSKVDIIFEGKIYKEGRLRYKTKAKHFSLDFGTKLRDRLKQVFLMSHMKYLEETLEKVIWKQNNPKKKWVKKNKPLSIHEFLDIEYDSKKKVFYLYAHFLQEPIFPLLFSSLSDNHSIKTFRKNAIQKNDWKKISEYKKDIHAYNVVYTLINITKKKIYIGIAGDFSERYTQSSMNTKWEYYRYDVLPAALNVYREDIERMLIRSFSSMMKSNNDILTKEISDFHLTNKKIDK